ncbi:hypothetical protein H0H81_006427 [Sphagnurus paluster]|uniref:ubiquitinyl hydrolase 1 n=1 Tax=Sphagnurus paluster TaxID=117069 RepID=A0A9P7GRX0_9AGAR|nr:hypothetical protein H0H81_006427 [Sphagnurus paluster]
MAKARWRFGLPSSQVPQDVSKPAPAPTLASADAKKFGLENALYFCTPFRDLLLQSPDASLAQTASSPVVRPTPPSPAPLAPVRRKPERKPSTTGTATVEQPTIPVAPIPPSPPSLFSALRSLFYYISAHPAERGTVSPRAFIEKLKEVNQVFNTTTHQDAHEFLNYLLNKIVEEVEEERKALEPSDDLSNSIATIDSNAGYPSQHGTLVHKLFEGVLTSETRCLTCETVCQSGPRMFCAWADPRQVSSRDESFLDLSIDIEQNSSVTACLRQFSASEMLCHKNKFFCDSCCDLQEAEKRMKIKRLPNVLALHLKRFKYQEDLQRYVKLAYRVAFPFELRLFNTVDEVDDADRLYNLFGIVVHIGRYILVFSIKPITDRATSGPHHGHYVSIVKAHGTWLLFDDDTVSPIQESEIAKYYGDSPAGSAYVLYYQAADIDSQKLGLKTEQSGAGADNMSITSNSHPQPVHPPGIPVPPLPEHTPALSLATSDSDSPMTSLPPPLAGVPSTSTSLPITIPSPLSAHNLSASTSSHSTSTSMSNTSSTPPTAPSLSLSPSPPPSSSSSAKVAASVSSLFKSVRKSPSMIIPTNGAPDASGVTTPIAPLPPIPIPIPLPSTPSRGEAGHAPRLGASVSASGSSAHSRTSVSRSTSLHGHSAPLPPLPTSPPSGREKEKEQEQEQDAEKGKEKDGEWRRWFGRTSTSALGTTSEPPLPNGAPSHTADGPRTEKEGSSADADIATNGTAQVYVNGVVRKESKEKEKGKTWFGKRKSFRLVGEKTLKGFVGSTSQTQSQDSSDALVPPSPTTQRDESSAASWFRTSLQLPQRRGSEIGEINGGAERGVPPQVAMSKSMPGPAGEYLSSNGKHRPQPLSTSHLKSQSQSSSLRPHVNGDVSPAPSSSSSLDLGTMTSTTPLTPNHPHHPQHFPQQHPEHPHTHVPGSSAKHTLPHRPTNGHTHTLPPPPRMLASVSTPLATIPASASSATHPPGPGFPHTHTLPDTPRSPTMPERKKSLASFPVFRSRDKERPKEKVWDSVLVSPAEHHPPPSERPLPPVPVPVRQQSRFFGKSVTDEPAQMLVESGEAAPGLASFGSANTSAASSTGGGGGIRRATRKLSLTAPMLGFGKRDKEKEKEKTKEKVAPSSFVRM